MILKKLISAANEMDRKGLIKEADLLDKLMSLVKQKIEDPDIETEEDESEEEEESSEEQFESCEVNSHFDGKELHVSGRVQIQGSAKELEREIKKLEKKIEEEVSMQCEGKKCKESSEHPVFMYEISKKYEVK